LEKHTESGEQRRNPDFERRLDAITGDLKEIKWLLNAAARKHCKCYCIAPRRSSFRPNYFLAGAGKNPTHDCLLPG
jgi:hypothetical protein